MAVRAASSSGQTGAEQAEVMQAIDGGRVHADQEQVEPAVPIEIGCDLRHAKGP